MAVLEKDLGLDFDIDTASPREIILRRLETERLEIIPVANILTEHAIIDDDHARELGASMQRKRGQITPIAARAKLDEQTGQVIYDVIDGFHRTEGKRKNGDPEIKANVLYGCSDEEMYDLRILAASSVRSIQFARIARWITDCFATTPWAQRGLSVAQAFAIAANDNASSYLLKDRDEATALKNWVRDKCNQWSRPVTSVYQLLRTVANADPGLVQRVRTSSGGRTIDTTLTQSKLSSVVNAFPGEENWAAQRVILNVALEKRLKIEGIDNICRQLEGKITPEMTEEEINELIQQAESEPKAMPTEIQKAVIVPLDAPVNSAKADNKSEDEDNEGDNNWWEKGPDEEELMAIERGDDETDIEIKTEKKKTAPDSLVGNSYTPRALARGDIHDLEGLRKRVADLEKALETANNNNGQTTNPETWWRTAIYLTPVERACMERVFYKNEPLEVVARDLKIASGMIINYMRSAFVRRNLVEPTLREEKIVFVKETG